MRVGEPYDLASGKTYIRLAIGVQLMIEGPARWEFTSQQRVLFHSGRLMAQVPRAAVGFTVVTPTAEVVDLGTEFGVVVDERSSTDVVVFRGQVAVTPQAAVPTPGATSGEQATTLVWAGQSHRISAQGVLTAIKPRDFGRPTGPESSIRHAANPTWARLPAASSRGSQPSTKDHLSLPPILVRCPTAARRSLGQAPSSRTPAVIFPAVISSVASWRLSGDPALDRLLQTQRFNPTLSADIPVTVGKQYELQLLFFEPGGLAFSRPMTITAEEDTLASYNINASGSVATWVKYGFTAADPTLNVDSRQRRQLDAQRLFVDRRDRGWSRARDQSSRS